MSKYDEYDYLDEQVPKHKKKKKKKVKKSKHGHVYNPYRIESKTKIMSYRDDSEKYWVFIIYKCDFCDKEKVETETLTLEELVELEAILINKGE